MYFILMINTIYLDQLQRLHGILGLPGLGDEDEAIISSHENILAIHDIRGQLQLAGLVDQLLDGGPGSQHGIVAGTAGDKDHAAAILNGRQEILDTPQLDVLVSIGVGICTLSIIKFFVHIYRNV